jgi:hypothetical protein
MECFEALFHEETHVRRSILRLVVLAAAVAGMASDSQAAGRCRKKVKCGNPCGVQNLIYQSMTSAGAAKRCR